MDWWSQVRQAAEQFFDQHGLLAAFVFLLVEEAGVPIPLPGDVLMVVLGIQARQGQIPLWQAIVVMQAATMLGATFLYGISRWGGRSLVYRYGRFIRLDPARLDDAERWLKQKGWLAVFLGRLLPGLRIVTAIACGVFAVPPWVFIPAMSLGALLYIVGYTLLGYFIGPPLLRALEQLPIPVGLLGSLVPLILLVVWFTRARLALADAIAAGTPLPRRDCRRAGATAGFLATVVSTLVINVLVNVFANLPVNTPGDFVESTAARLARVLARGEVAPWALLLALPLFLVVGVLWGVAFAELEGRLPRIPDWARGMLFSLLPLALSLTVVMPLLGLGFFGASAAGALAAIGEAIRHAAFGAMLGVAYSVLVARRRLRKAGRHTVVTPATTVEAQTG